MISIESMYICFIVPIVIAILFMPRTKRKYGFFVLIGITVCLCSAYYNSFYGLIYNVPVTAARIEIAPLVEEVMKFLPVVCYLIIWKSSRSELLSASVTIAISFAVFENVAYLLEGSMVDMQVILIRGLSVTAMHVLTSIIVSEGLSYAWKWGKLKFVVSVATLCVAITLHGQFNLMMYTEGVLQIIGAFLPILSLFAIKIIISIKKVKKQEN